MTAGRAQEYPHHTPHSRTPFHTTQIPAYAGMTGGARRNDKGRRRNDEEARAGIPTSYPTLSHSPPYHPDSRLRGNDGQAAHRNDGRPRAQEYPPSTPPEQPLR